MTLSYGLEHLSLETNSHIMAKVTFCQDVMCTFAT
jgi:hypothetical protein